MNDEITNFDEDEDIILPNSIWGELVYVGFIIYYGIRQKKDMSCELRKLKRQIWFFFRWMKNK